MTAIDWFSLMHPVLVMLFVYSVVATTRLRILVREKPLGITQPRPLWFPCSARPWSLERPSLEEQRACRC